MAPVLVWSKSTTEAEPLLRPKRLLLSHLIRDIHAIRGSIPNAREAREW
jgi:hypothetical protein